MVYAKIYHEKIKEPIVYVYNIEIKEDLKDFYDEFELKLYGKLNSGFGRNLNAFDELLQGGYGKLLEHVDK